MPKLADRKDCTGCAACFAACKFDALRMIPDDEGFLRPVVDVDACRECSACTNKCPVVTYPELSRMQEPEIYAIRAADDVRAMSSSGGVFPLLAKWMLGRGGVVAGAIIDYSDDLHVKHVVSDDESTVREMSSSKYVQSEIDASVYTDITNALKAGRDVLFSGCPCQVAGVYAYVGKRKYDGTLYTMDFFCHGVPSPAIYEKYLRETYGDRMSEIERFDFRDKSVFGWSTCINVYFKDGTEEHIHMDEDPYYQMFLPCAMQRPSCAVCMFSKLPRRADMSVGDFWGCENYDRNLNDGKGTSFALVNSTQGLKMFHSIRNDIPRLSTEVPLDAILPVNPTPIHPFRAHPGREHIFRFREVFPIGKLTDHGLRARYDIGIVSKWYADEVTALSTYALAKLAEEDGHDAVVIEKPGYIMRNEELYDDERAPRKLIRKKCFTTGRRGVSWQEMEHNETCEQFVFLCDANDRAALGVLGDIVDDGARVDSFTSRAIADERDYFAGRFVAPTHAKTMLNDNAVWVPALTLKEDDYRELVAEGLLPASLLDGGHVGDGVPEVLAAIICKLPFTYTGTDAAILGMLEELGITKTIEANDGEVIGIGLGDGDAEWGCVQKKLDEFCKVYKKGLFTSWDCPHAYDRQDVFTAQVMSESLESHRKSDALRKRVEELEHRMDAVDGHCGGAGDVDGGDTGLVGKGMRYMREHGVKATAKKALGYLGRGQ